MTTIVMDKAIYLANAEQTFSHPSSPLTIEESYKIMSAAFERQRLGQLGIWEGKDIGTKHSIQILQNDVIIFKERASTRRMTTAMATIAVESNLVKTAGMKASPGLITPPSSRSSNKSHSSLDEKSLLSLDPEQLTQMFHLDKSPAFLVKEAKQDMQTQRELKKSELENRQMLSRTPASLDLGVPKFSKKASKVSTKAPEKKDEKADLIEAEKIVQEMWNEAEKKKVRFDKKVYFENNTDHSELVRFLAKVPKAEKIKVEDEHPVRRTQVRFDERVYVYTFEAEETDESESFVENMWNEVEKKVEQELQQHSLFITPPDTPPQDD